MAAAIHPLHPPLEWRESPRAKGIWRAMNLTAKAVYQIEGLLFEDVDGTVREYYAVDANRRPIGNASTLKEAKALAQRHEDGFIR
jgi:hypothetical protein